MIISAKHTSAITPYIVLIALVLPVLSCSKPDIKPPPAPHIIMADEHKKEVPPSADLYYYVLKGNICASHYDIECALSAFFKAMEIDGKSAFIHYQIAQLFTLAGELEHAVEWTKRALDLAPGDTETARFLVQLYMGLNDVDAAINRLEEILRQDPHDTDSLFTLAFLYAEQNDYTRALGIMKDYIDKHPASVRGYYYLGNLLSDIGEYDLAITSYEHAALLDPEFKSALISIAAVHENRGDIDQAAETYHRVLKVYPFDFSVRNRLAYLFVKNNQLDEAIAQYEFIMETDPESYHEMSMKIGLVYYEKQRWDLAEKHLLKILDAHPDNDRVIYYLGNVYEKMGALDKALNWFIHIPRTSKFYPQAQIHLAHIHELEGNLEATIVGLKEAIKFMKEEMTIYRFLASLYERENNLDEAKNILRDALEVNPRDEDTLYYLGMLYFNTSKFDESIEIMESILKINPMNADALNFIGYSYAEKGIKLDKAERLIKKALQIKPDDGYITDSLGWVYYQRGDYKKALNILLRALELLPEDPVITEHVADAYLKLNNIPEAIKHYKRAIELDPDREEVQKKLHEIKQR